MAIWKTKTPVNKNIQFVSQESYANSFLELEKEDSNLLAKEKRYQFYGGKQYGKIGMTATSDESTVSPQMEYQTTATVKPKVIWYRGIVKLMRNTTNIAENSGSDTSIGWIVDRSYLEKSLMWGFSVWSESSDSPLGIPWYAIPMGCPTPIPKEVTIKTKCELVMKWGKQLKSISNYSFYNESANKGAVKTSTDDQNLVPGDKDGAVNVQDAVSKVFGAQTQDSAEYKDSNDNALQQCIRKKLVRLSRKAIYQCFEKGFFDTHKGGDDRQDGRSKWRKLSEMNQQMLNGEFEFVDCKGLTDAVVYGDKCFKNAVTFVEASNTSIACPYFIAKNTMFSAPSISLYSRCINKCGPVFDASETGYVGHSDEIYSKYGIVDNFVEDILAPSKNAAGVATMQLSDTTLINITEPKTEDIQVDTLQQCKCGNTTIYVSGLYPGNETTCTADQSNPNCLGAVTGNCGGLVGDDISKAGLYKSITCITDNTVKHGELEIVNPVKFLEEGDTDYVQQIDLKSSKFYARCSCVRTHTNISNYYVGNGYETEYECNAAVNNGNLVEHCKLAADDDFSGNTDKSGMTANLIECSQAGDARTVKKNVTCGNTTDVSFLKAKNQAQKIVLYGLQF